MSSFFFSIEQWFTGEYVEEKLKFEDLIIPSELQRTMRPTGDTQGSWRTAVMRSVLSVWADSRR